MFSRMLDAIHNAKHSIRLETYIYNATGVGTRLRDALVQAQNRGVAVRVMVDAWGSSSLPASFWTPLQAVSGQFRWFNPLPVWKLGIRNHRKLLVVDDHRTFIGGFNIAPEYEGDGIEAGWRDLGIEFHGGVANDLARSFDHLFDTADLKRKPFVHLRRTEQRQSIQSDDGTALLLSGPGRGRSQFESMLVRDIRAAKPIRIVAAYFLPTNRVRRALRFAAARGADVSVILPGKSDVPVSQLASRSHYQSLLRSGVRLFEYQPQILHAKLVIANGAAYVGSANLDRRSFHINYELTVRFQSPEIVAGANAAFADILRHSRPIELASWKKSRSFLDRWKERWSYFLLAGLDPYIAKRQLKTLR